MERHQDTSRRTTDRRRKRYMQKRLIITFLTLLLMTGAGVLAVTFAPKKENKKEAAGKNTLETSAKPAEKEQIQEQIKEPVPEQKEETEDVRSTVLAQAELLAAGYDYDGAIEMVKSYQGYERDSELTAKVSDYEAKKAACVPVNIDEVTHVFYHSLVVDPELAFANQDTNPQAVGNNQWMTTIEEFNKITQAMYDKGYVLVDLHDLVEETTDENGNVHFKAGTIMLPPDKKAFVLSIDDLSYYHSYDGYGYASKMIVDENGKPKCEYIQRDGTTVVGDFDVIPLMDKFLEEHPDASYKGAKGTIALTGYNGILGYRTDISYQTVPEDIDEDKKKWLENHPDFNLETERANAKKVADAIKADGWKFASHTWGHMKVGEASIERIQTDTQKWKENVEPLIGATDTIIFAHGEDLAEWTTGYTPDNAKFNYLKEQGFNYFCNVDSKQYSVQIKDNYFRQGRRNLDGYRIYYNSIGEMDSVSDLFNASEVIDPKRPPVPRLK
ncbi:MAG: polysaccharide deacetylase [Lachnospiraceae bacterium]|nr:polysaccharide deacetylase [Lachnospiraceae bacterium]